MTKIIRLALSKLSKPARIGKAPLLLPKKVMYPTRFHKTPATTLPIVDEGRIKFMDKKIQILAEISNFPTQPENLQIQIALTFKTEFSNCHSTYRGFELKRDGSKVNIEATISLEEKGKLEHAPSTLDSIEFIIVKLDILDQRTELWQADYQKQNSGKFY